ncbi:MAG: hypothetical protein H7A03_09955 [Pseudomonadales bacterium]|nr:hypothetical protein [Pseudomonadales bacterium]
MIKSASACNVDFVLIDLGCQIEAVQAYTRSWTKDQILSWLGHYGTIHDYSGFRIHHTFKELIFEPYSFPQLSWGFYFDENDHIQAYKRPLK